MAWRARLVSAVLFVTCLQSPSVPALAQKASADFNKLVEELAARPEDDDLRKKVIQRSLALKPPPAVPEEARRRMVRAQAFAEQAVPNRSQGASELVLTEYKVDRPPWDMQAVAILKLPAVTEKAKPAAPPQEPK